MQHTITFKKLTATDVPLLSDWFKLPHVSAWWPVPKEHEDIVTFLQRTRENVSSYIVLVDTHAIGYIQSYTPSGNVAGSEQRSNWLPQLPENTLGIDQFIGDPEYMGKGYGTLFIKEFITYLAQHTPCSCVIVDPEPINYAAIRCYEKVGFKKVGEYDAPWGRALLMRYDVVKNVNYQQTIIFDLGGVLLQEPERNLSKVLPQHLTLNNSDTRIFNRMFDFLEHVQPDNKKRAWFLGMSTSEHIVKCVQQNIDNPKYASFFKDEHERNLIKHGAEYVLLPHHLKSLTHLDAQGLAFVQRCKAAGIRLLILSNWDPASFAAIVHKFPELFSLFQERDIFISAKTGCMKPEPECFEYIQRTTGIPLHELFFVDDSVTNAQAGLRAGLRAVHHCDWETTIQELQKLGLEL